MRGLCLQDFRNFRKSSGLEVKGRVRRDDHEVILTVNSCLLFDMWATRRRCVGLMGP
jgi:hypothetical protein